MPLQAEDDAAVDAFIAAAARMLDLTVDPAWQAAVRTHMQVTMRLAAVVGELELPDEAEPAPVYGA
jgi:hypothetical protein